MDDDPNNGNDDNVASNGKEEHPKNPLQCSSSDDDEDLVILVLGDGDFSYSYDLARHLAALKAPVIQNILGTKKRLRLVATGLDSAQAVSDKYKDSAFLLKNIKALDDNTNKDDDKSDDAISLHVSVHHGINALQADLPFGFRQAHHVLFNHPHLGEENAILHSQFLCHLFHAVSKTWMISSPSSDSDEKKMDGFFHITLVKGQFERWNCLEAAKRQGMKLLHQHPFRSPRVPNPYYQHRRHQTGKSFAARAPQGSVMYTFVRQLEGSGRRPKNNGPLSSEDSNNHLVTEALLDLTQDDDMAAAVAGAQGTNQDMAASDSLNQFPCPHCDKSFREERSRKNHIRSVHPAELDSSNSGEGAKKRKRENGDEQQQQSTHVCDLCPSKDGTPGPRIFNSAQALEDHRKAKHLAAHPVIKPDWHKPAAASPNDPQLPQQSTPGDATTNSSNNTVSDKPFGCCDICGATFLNETDQSKHMQAFLPSDITASTTTTTVGSNNGAIPLPYRCTYCPKEFREQRAQKQHENFCSARLKSLT